MKRLRIFAPLVLLIGATAAGGADRAGQTMVVTASNGTSNQLLVYDPSGTLLQMLPTGGQGGVSGNSGGIAAQGKLLAVVNFGSQNVTIFVRTAQGFRMGPVLSSVSKPVSVAFGHGHLYILGTTTVESHRLAGLSVQSVVDGMTLLAKADMSSAQVGVVGNQLIISEKSNVIETVNLAGDGSVTGSPTRVQNLPDNADTPFGLITRGDNAYVSIAHSNQIVLVRNGRVLTVTGSGNQQAPCWLALNGPFLYSANTASMSITRFAVYGQKIVLDGEVAAKLNGGATDIDSKDGLLAVVDANGPVSHLSIFAVDEDGNLALNASTTINNPINGVVIVGAAGSDE
jgi:hypothetical protein